MNRILLNKQTWDKSWTTDFSDFLLCLCDISTLFFIPEFNTNIIHPNFSFFFLLTIEWMNKWRMNEKLVSKCSGINGIKLSIVASNYETNEILLYTYKWNNQIEISEKKWKETKTLEENEVENNDNDWVSTWRWWTIVTF